MKVGLIARANKRGIGYQTQQFHDNYPVDRTLLVLDGQRRWPEDPTRYPDATIANFDIRNSQYEEVDLVKDWLTGLDVVFAVETPYDWEMCDWVRAAGARLVVQGNPEFWVDRPWKPDVWGWPTPWLSELVPAGKPLPVPVVTPPRGPVTPDSVFTVVHVAGHHAHGDRNGTYLFMHALGNIRVPCRVRIVGQDGELPREARTNANVDLDLIPEGVEDRWDLYEGAHLVVLPRRYGGLSMPTLEALAAGVVVAMTDCPPNSIWPTVPLPCRLGRGLRVPLGPIRLWDCHAVQMARVIDRLNTNRDEWALYRSYGDEFVRNNGWDQLRPVYNKVFGGAMRML